MLLAYHDERQMFFQRFRLFRFWLWQVEAKPARDAIAEYACVMSLGRTPLRPKDLLVELRSPAVRSHAKSKENGPTIDVREAGYQRSWEPRLARKPSLLRPISQACTAEQIYNTRYRQWVDEMHQPFVVHRKQWEWVYIAQCLDYTHAWHTTHGQTHRGLGFGVGTEPIGALAAKRGCEILGTDMAYANAEKSGWVETDQHAASVEQMNPSDVCDRETFRQRASFRVVDMREIPDDLRGFDFTWSACAFEHLGSLQAGLDFVQNSLRCLKPGGIAVHTTEYNVSSNRDTIDTGPTVLYRRRDFQTFARALRAEGHQISLTFGLGTTEDDRHIDFPPYSNCHLKSVLDGFVITSFGLLIQKVR